MKNYLVVLNFDDGVHNYNLPHVTYISDPKEGIKAVVIEGNRGDGSIVIPGGKKSQIIRVRGVIINHNGYEALTNDINTLKTNITTNVATLTLKHFTGSIWQPDWSYTVRRINEITFLESNRTNYQEYEIEFLVISY